MSPQPHSSVLPAVVLALALIGFVILAENRKLAEDHDRLRVERSRRRELEQQLETRRVQLDGALEKITELSGPRPGASPADG